MKPIIQKILDEGTAEPFIARLVAGVFELREQVFNLTSSSLVDDKARRDAFDRLYEPVFNEMVAMRKAVKAIHNLVEVHRSRVESVDIQGMQQNAIEIPESIDHELRDLFAHFLITAIRAAKSMQKVTVHFGLDIGGFFVKDSNFEARMNSLEASSHKPLVDYFRFARKGWSQQLILRRNACEHENWLLPDVRYPPTVDGRMRMMEPEIDGITVTRWVVGHCKHVLAFVENSLIYAFQTSLTRHGMAIVEIPIMKRMPEFPKRFRVTIPVVESITPWCPKYEPEGFE